MNFQILAFWTIMGKEPIYHNFWHSSNMVKCVNNLLSGGISLLLVMLEPYFTSMLAELVIFTDSVHHFPLFPLHRKNHV